MCDDAINWPHAEEMSLKPVERTLPRCLLTSKLGILCRKQVIKTTKGQSSGCIITPAAWAQLTWKAVGQRPCEHCTQQPAFLFLRFLQKTHFCRGESTCSVHGSPPPPLLAFPPKCTRPNDQANPSHNMKAPRACSKLNVSPH